MFSYFGTKKALAKYYPAPKYPLIVEPFCGAGRYSLYGDNWKNQVLLLDIYPIIIEIWKYLISPLTTPESILALPDLNKGDNVDSFPNLTQEQKWLIGFCINSASAVPKKTAQARTQWNRSKIEIAENLYKVKHWQAMNYSYDMLGNEEATWFVDPPYSAGGQYYRYGNSKINYSKLAEWCKERKGQVIVCENDKADWLPFTPLAKLNGQLHSTMEVIYTQG